jgi:hypothetical protein
MCVPFKVQRGMRSLNIELLNGTKPRLRPGKGFALRFALASRRKPSSFGTNPVEH